MDCNPALSATAAALHSPAQKRVSTLHPEHRSHPGTSVLSGVQVRPEPPCSLFRTVFLFSMLCIYYLLLVVCETDLEVLMLLVRPFMVMLTK